MRSISKHGMGHHYGYVRALDLENNKNAFG